MKPEHNQSCGLPFTDTKKNSPRLFGGVPLVVENREGVFSRYPKKTTGSWSESDRGGTRLCEKVYNLVVKGKVFLDRIG